MSRNRPFLRQPITGADHLSPEDQCAIDMIAGLSAAIMQICGKDLGLSDEEISRAPQGARDLWTGYVTHQRANGEQP